MISSISIEELKSKIGSIHLIDIRSVEKYNDNHIDTAIHIPSDKLILEPKKYLNFTDTYYIYCQKGSKSVKLCMFLQKQGFKVINVKGGYESWVLES